jgi:hypothetical protein
MSCGRTLAVLASALSLWPQSGARPLAKPVIGKSTRYSGAPASGGTTAFRYKIEVSPDGKSYSTILDKSNNSVTRYTEFDEIPPARCRYVRLTLTDWPRTGNAPLGIVEFTVFGTAALQR